MRGNILRFKKDELKRHTIFKSVSAIKAFTILEEIIKPTQSGFDIFRLPPAEYLLDCIYSINPMHEIFHLPSKVMPTR